LVNNDKGGEEVEAIIKKQSHYREAAATAPSESMIPLGHVWCAQTTGHCQYLPCIINPPNSFFLPEMTDFSTLMAIIIRETEQWSPAAEPSPVIFNK